MEQPLLTIAIPTYNRSGFLNICLTSIISQLQDIADKIEIMVFDNYSNDGTTQVVTDHINNGIPIKYFKKPMQLRS